MTPSAAAPARPAIHATRDADLARARGALSLGFARGADGETRLARLAQRTPARALRPDDDAAEALAVVLNTAGGLCGGDRFDVTVSLGPGAHACVTTQAAEKVYRALDSPARVRNALRLEAGARLHWAPRETILFDGARLGRCMEIRADAGSRLLATEMLVFGRRAMREVVGRLDLRDDWRVRVGDTLLWADALALVGEPPEALAAPAGLDGHEALATILWLAPDPEAACAILRAHLVRHRADGMQAGVSALRGLGIARLLGSASAVRGALADATCRLRGDALGFCGAPPRAVTL